MSHERNLPNESVKSTAQTSGKTVFCKHIDTEEMGESIRTKKGTSRMPLNFCFLSKNLTNLERRFQRAPSQFSQVVAFHCMTVHIILYYHFHHPQLNRIMCLLQITTCSVLGMSLIQGRARGTELQLPPDRSTRELTWVEEAGCSRTRTTISSVVKACKSLLLVSV